MSSDDEMTDIGGALVPVAEVRRHVADLARFRAYLPLARELEDHDDMDSPAVEAVIERAEDIEALHATLCELSMLCDVRVAELETAAAIRRAQKSARAGR